MCNIFISTLWSLSSTGCVVECRWVYWLTTSSSYSSHLRTFCHSGFSLSVPLSWAVVGTACPCHTAPGLGVWSHAWPVSSVCRPDLARCLADTGSGNCRSSVGTLPPRAFAVWCRRPPPKTRSSWRTPRQTRSPSSSRGYARCSPESTSRPAPWSPTRRAAAPGCGSGRSSCSATPGWSRSASTASWCPTPWTAPYGQHPCPAETGRAKTDDTCRSWLCNRIFWWLSIALNRIFWRMITRSNLFHYDVTRRTHDDVFTWHIHAWHSWCYFQIFHKFACLLCKPK